MELKVAERAASTARCARESLFLLESTQFTQLRVTPLAADPLFCFLKAKGDFAPACPECTVPRHAQ